MISNSITGKFILCGRMLMHLLLFVVCLNPLLLYAQNYPTRKFTMRDGLPGMAIQCIYKDSRGLMWIGTNSGLCTFDGKSFRIFKPSEGMTANQVWAIAEDEEGNMWFGSYGDGLYKYDGKHFNRFTKNEGLVSDYIRVLCYSTNFHCLIAGCEGGVSTIKGDSITSSPPEIFRKDNGSTVTGLADAGDFIYITTYGTNNPLRYYPNENKFIPANNKELYSPVNSFSVFITSKGDTVFSHGHSGVTIYKKDRIVQNESMGQVFGIAEDKRGDLWFASWSYQNRHMIEGVFRYDSKTFRNYKNAFGITDKEIWTVFYDPEQDILWIGTINEGLFRVPFSGIEQFPPTYFNLEEQKINDVYIDSENSLWISGNRELIRITPDGNYSFMGKTPMLSSFSEYWKKTKRKEFSITVDSIFLAAKKLDKSQIYDFKKRIDFDYNMALENSGNSFLFSNRFGLFQTDSKNNKTRYIGPDGFADLFATTGKDTIVFSGWGYTILNTEYGKNSIAISDSSIISFTKEYDPLYISRLVKEETHFWYTSWTSGLWMSEGMYLVNFNKKDSTISKNLNDVCFDEKGNVIFGSNTGEICIATFAGNKLNIDYRISSDNGLQGNSITWLVADQKGKLWAGTNLGVNCIDLDSLYRREKYIIRFMDEEEGYTGHASKKAVLDKNENLWIGAGDQLIKLNHAENDLVFSFDVLNYNNPAKDRFRYMLQGYDKNWSEWSTERNAVYTNLHPGKYSLIVESFNLRTLEQADSLSIEFTIRHPWWGLWYLQVIIGFIILVSALSIVRNVRKYTEAERIKQLKKSEIEKTIVELEMQALQAQMNPHFIFNCINGIQYYVLANKIDKVLAYLSDFSKVVRGSLENATLDLVSLEKEIDFLQSYLKLELMRFADKFEYKINSLGIVNTGNVFLPPMLVQPFAENAVRHGFMYLATKGHLVIGFEETGTDVLKCIITDNGIGRDKAKSKEESSQMNDRLHSAMITEKRLRLFNSPNTPEKYKIVYTERSEKGNPCGLKVELCLPMEKGRG